MMDHQISKNCIVYCRVSSSKQAQQGESLEDQELIGCGIAQRLGLNIIHVLKEPYSARKGNRPVFDEIFTYLKKNPKKIHVLIFRGIDRFTRKGTLDYETLKQRLTEYGVQLIDGHGIIQPAKNTLEHLGVEYSWSKTYPSEIAELVMAQQSKNEVTQILTRMIGAEINLVRDGYHVCAARDGYINSRVFVDGKKKLIQAPDPNRAHFFTKMFELRASKSYTDKEIVNQINAMGYRSPVYHKWSESKDRIIGTSGGKELKVKRLQFIISNPIYCGVNTGKWLTKPIKTKYPGLVSIDLFNEANRGKVFIQEFVDGQVAVHYDYKPHNTKRMKDNPLFPYKSIILCPECKKPFMGSVVKGKSGQGFPTYHCSRKHKWYGVNKKNFENSLFEFIKSLRYEESFWERFEKVLIKKYKEKETELDAVSTKVNKNVMALETEKLQKIEAFASTKNEVIRSELEKQIENLQIQINESQQQTISIEINQNDINSFLHHAKKLMEHPVELLLKQENFMVLKELFGLVFDESPTYTEICNGTPKLSLVYRLSERFWQGKSLIAGNEELRWNDIETTIIKWNNVFKGIEHRNQYNSQTVEIEKIEE